MSVVGNHTRFILLAVGSSGTQKERTSRRGALQTGPYLPSRMSTQLSHCRRVTYSFAFNGWSHHPTFDDAPRASVRQKQLFRETLTYIVKDGFDKAQPCKPVPDLHSRPDSRTASSAATLADNTILSGHINCFIGRFSSSLPWIEIWHDEQQHRRYRSSKLMVHEIRCTARCGEVVVGRRGSVAALRWLSVHTASMRRACRCRCFSRAVFPPGCANQVGR